MANVCSHCGERPTSTKVFYQRETFCSFECKTDWQIINQPSVFGGDELPEPSVIHGITTSASLTATSGAGRKKGK